MEESVRVSPAARPSETAGLISIVLGAFVSSVLSVSLWFTGNHDQGIFVGLWMPSILALAGLVRGRPR